MAVSTPVKAVDLSRISEVMQLIASKQTGLRYERHLEAREIRLLRLKAIENDSDFEARLEYYSLDEAPQYRALSYVWGATAEWVPVSLGHGRTCFMTPNLQSALLVIVRIHEECLLWVDQICINQSNLVEKTEQVGLMGLIYGRASETIIWLGDDLQHHAPDAFRWFQRLYAFMQPLIATYFQAVKGAPRETLMRELDREARSLTTPDSAAALFSFCSLPWFSRAWVVQEAVLSKYAILYWGGERLAWATFISTFWFFRYCALYREILAGQNQSRSLSGLNDSLISVRMELFAELDFVHRGIVGQHGHVRNELACYLPRSIYLDCKEKRDKVIAILGLCIDGSNLSRDYTQSEESFFRDVALEIISQKRETRCDCEGFYCSFNEMSMFYNVETTKQIEGWPSWVLTWERDETALATEPLHVISAHLKYQPCKGSKPWIKIGSDSKQILVRGVIWDRVVTCGTIAPPDFTADFTAYKDHEEAGLRFNTHRAVFEWNSNFAHLMVEAEKLGSRCHAYKKPEDQFEAVWRTLCADAGHSFEPYLLYRIPRNVAKEYGRLFEAFRSSYVRFADAVSSAAAEPLQSPETWKMLCQGPLRDINREWADKTLFWKVIRNRRVFVTEQGFMGLGPGRMRDNDLVSIFSGAMVPMIIREKPDSTHRVVGQCYVHGIMDGEILEMEGYSEQYIQDIMIS